MKCRASCLFVWIIAFIKYVSFVCTKKLKYSTILTHNVEDKMVIILGKNQSRFVW